MVDNVDSSRFNELVLESDVPVLVDFFQLHCLPCKKLVPVLEDAAEKIGGKGKIYTVQFEISPELVIKYDIFSFPTMILFSNGQEAKRMIGPRSLEAVLEVFGE